MNKDTIFLINALIRHNKKTDWAQPGFFSLKQNFYFTNTPFIGKARADKQRALFTMHTDYVKHKRT